MADQDYNRGGTNWWDPSSAARTASGADSGAAAALQVMGLGLSSQQQQQQQQQQPLDQWNHPLLRSDNKSGAEMGGGGGGGFRSMLQEGMAPFRLGSADVQAAEPEFKPIKGFSLDQQFLDSPSSSVYGNSFQTLIGASDQQQGGYGYQHQHQHQQQQNYGMSNSENLMGSGGGGWNKIDHQFLKPSSMLDPSNSSSNKPIHSSQFSGGGGGGGGLFWNMADVPRPPPASFFPVASPLLNQQQEQHQLSIPCFDEKPQHNVMEVRDTGGPGRKASGGSSSDQTTTSAVTTSTGGTATKRSRNEASSALPPFKVRKEKMGDRITALQQLVSPFGKTDTASVLSEAIEYIKFLHEQVNVLSTPYLKSGASLQHQQSSDKSKDPDGSRQDLRSRGLCLVPLSSTFPVTHETTVDLWTPTFGGTFR